MSENNWTWEPDIPQDIRDIVLPHLDRWQLLIPTWCQDFSIRYDPRKEALCSVEVCYRNRWALLVITGRWLEVTDEARDVALLHELIHINLEPLTLAGGNIIESMAESVAQTLAKSSHLEGMEAAVQDLARGIHRMIAP